jgi:hypothetical protein
MNLGYELYPWKSRLFIASLWTLSISQDYRAFLQLKYVLETHVEITCG